MITFVVFLIGGYVLSMFFEDYLTARRSERAAAFAADSPAPRRQHVLRRWLDPQWSSAELGGRMKRYGLGFLIVLAVCLGADVLLFPVEDAFMNSVTGA